jgi:hypothetical protein
MRRSCSPINVSQVPPPGSSPVGKSSIPPSCHTEQTAESTTSSASSASSAGSAGSATASSPAAASSATVSSSASSASSATASSSATAASPASSVAAAAIEQAHAKAQAQQRVLNSILRATDPYDRLGLPRDASALDIKRAFQERSKLVHPDKNPSPRAKEAFQSMCCSS